MKAAAISRVPGQKLEPPSDYRTYAVGEIGLAKISLISLSEIAAKCNASPVGKRTVSPLSNPRTRDAAEGEEKKQSEWDVKIKRNERRKKGVDGGK